MRSLDSPTAQKLFDTLVLINAESISVDIFCLNERGKWELTPYTQGDEIELISVNFKFAIELLYEDVKLPETSQNIDVGQAGFQQM